MKPINFTLYSDTAIRAYFFQYFKYNQISTEIFKNPNLCEAVFEHLVQKHIKFRNALINPTCNENLSLIKNHAISFFDNNDHSNSQMRGPQIHVSQQIFHAFYTPIILFTGLDFSINLNNKNVTLQESMLLSGPSSFRHGIEIPGAKSLSKVTGDHVYMTDDKKFFGTSNQSILVNTPPNQKNGDYIRLKIFDGKEFLIEEDGKSQSSKVAESKNFPQVAMVDSLDFEKHEKPMVSNIAKRAIMGVIPVRHIDNNDELRDAILRDLERTGKIEDTKGELLGFPLFLTNRHNIDDVD